jgi:hypothetical protein
MGIAKIKLQAFEAQNLKSLQSQNRRPSKTDSRSMAWTLIHGRLKNVFGDGKLSTRAVPSFLKTGFLYGTMANAKQRASAAMSALARTKECPQQQISGHRI